MVRLGQSHFDNFTVSESAFIIVFRTSLVPTESHSHQEWCINVHSREEILDMIYCECFMTLG